LLGLFFGHIRSVLGLLAQSKGVLGSYDAVSSCNPCKRGLFCRRIDV
jgi:hypothetical protein